MSKFIVFDIEKNIEASVVRIYSGNSFEIILSFAGGGIHKFEKEIYFKKISKEPCKTSPFVETQVLYRSLNFEQEKQNIIIYDFERVDNMRENNSATKSININISGSNNSVVGANIIEQENPFSQASEKIDKAPPSQKKNLLEKIKSFFSNSYVSGFKVNLLYDFFKNMIS